MNSLSSFTENENWLANSVAQGNNSITEAAILRSLYPLFNSYEKLLHHNLNELHILTLYFLDCKKIGRKRSFTTSEKQAMSNLSQAITDLGAESAGFVLLTSFATATPWFPVDFIGTAYVLDEKKRLTGGVVNFATQLGLFIRTIVTHGSAATIEMAKQPDPFSKVGAVIVGTATLMAALPVQAVQVATDLLSQPSSQTEIAYWLGYIAFKEFTGNGKGILAKLWSHTDKTLSSLGVYPTGRLLSGPLTHEEPQQDIDDIVRSIRLQVARNTAQKLIEFKTCESLEFQEMIQEVLAYVASLPQKGQTTAEEQFVTWVTTNKIANQLLLG